MLSQVTMINNECDLIIYKTRTDNSTYSIRTWSTTNHITYDLKFMIRLLQTGRSESESEG